jgi:exopolysaccharide biosynthesis WecB/TagA/CpsF family protein
MSEQDAVDAGDEMAPGVDGKIHFPRVIVGGLPVAVVDRRRIARVTIATALSRRGLGRPCAFFTSINGHVVSLCASRPDIKRIFEQADLIAADGMSVVFASRLGPGQPLPERVATTDSFHDVARLARERGASFYLLGANSEMNRAAAEQALKIHPGLKIAGHRHGYFVPEEEDEIVQEINAAAPDVLWVGLGAPREQRFILRNVHRLTSVGVATSCGGLFDFLAGKNRRAPPWMRRAGLEWMYRAWQEPRRLTWRYLTTGPHAALCLLRRRGLASDGMVDIDLAASRYRLDSAQ